MWLRCTRVVPIRLSWLKPVAERDELLTVFEVADHLKVNPQTVRNWIDAGRLRSTRLRPRRVRVRQSELDRFIAAGDSDSGPQADGEAAVDPGLSEALASAAHAKDSAELTAARRRVAATAELLADALDGHRG